MAQMLWCRSRHSELDINKRSAKGVIINKDDSRERGAQRGTAAWLI